MRYMNKYFNSISPLLPLFPITQEIAFIDYRPTKYISNMTNISEQ